MKKELLVQIKNFVEDYCNKYGYGPSVRIIQNEFNIAIGTAQRYLAELKNNGELIKDQKNGYVSSSYDYDNDRVEIKILGGISCGQLAESQAEDRGYIKLPRALIGKGDFFMIQACGDSMIEAGIDNGDLILVRKQSLANVGQIIVALVENQSTLKVLGYSKDVRKYYLHPMNKNYSDIYVDDLQVQGVLSMIIKDKKDFCIDF